MRRRTRGALPLRRLVPIGVAAAVASAASCTQEVENAEVRSLERSGRVAFVCLDKPGTVGGVARPLSDCGKLSGADPDDFSNGPHIYALVTQTTRGEIAVVDLNADNQPVLDQNPLVPGSTFLPVGAQPVDIASTPGGTATLVAVAQVGHAGLFALPSYCSTGRPSTSAVPAFSASCTSSVVASSSSRSS